jgi:lipopolysaccharide biosynthesis glycosyltransferase
MSIPDSKITVVFAADDKFAMPLAVAIRSLVANFQDQRGLHIYVLGLDISAENQQRIRQSLYPNKAVVELTFVAVDIAPIQDLYSSMRFPTAVYIRLLMPFYLPLECKKAIYLDSDLLVLGNMSELWDQDVADVSVMALHEMDTSATNTFERFPEFGLPSETKYFNSGVLVINLIRWRQERISERAIEFTRRFPHTIYAGDQDGLNAAIGGKFTNLDPAWNTMPILKDPKNIHFAYTSVPKIIHFGMPRKPWLPGRVVPEKAWFFDYLNQTAWKGRLTHKQKIAYSFECLGILTIEYYQRLRLTFIEFLDSVGLKEPIKKVLGRGAEA